MKTQSITYVVYVNSFKVVSFSIPLFLLIIKSKSEISTSIHFNIFRNPSMHLVVISHDTRGFVPALPSHSTSIIIYTVNTCNICSIFYSKMNSYDNVRTHVDNVKTYLNILLFVSITIYWSCMNLEQTSHDLKE